MLFKFKQNIKTDRGLMVAATLLFILSVSFLSLGLSSVARADADGCLTLSGKSDDIENLTVVYYSKGCNLFDVVNREGKARPIGDVKQENVLYGSSMTQLKYTNGQYEGSVNSEAVVVKANDRLVSSEVFEVFQGGKFYTVPVYGKLVKPPTKEEVQADEAAKDAVMERFGKNLDGVRAKFINDKCSKVDFLGETDRKLCENTFWPNVKQCLGRAENEHSLAIGRHQSDESARKLMDEKFSSCLSDKTGVSKSDILTAINGLDLLDILRDSNDAHNTAMQEYKDKESCEDAGFEWDDSTNPPSCMNPNASTCTIGGVGWFLCPVIDFMAEIADKAYELLAETFLMIPSSMFESNGETYNAWKIFQSIANVILVIAFLVIVFSQLTGFGLSNYGIKKSLPKLIIVAILMNLSFIICALAVDLSNIIGVSLKSLFETMAQTVTNPRDLAERYTPGSTGNPIAGIMTGAAIGGVGILASGGVTLALIAFIPVLLAIVLSLILIFFILVGRQAIIILLVVISPLAFAMYLLPNTQGWFTKWRKTFLALLMVFPIIGLVYGVSDFASNVLSQVYQGAGGVAQEIGAIVAAGILAIPFFVVPSLLKKSLDAVGNIGAMAGNLTARASRGLDNKLQDSDMAKAKRQQHRDRTQSIRAGRYGGSNPFNKARSTMNTKLNSGQGAYGQYRRRQVDKYDAAQAREAQEAIGGAGDYLSSFTYDNEHGGKSNLSSNQIFDLAMGRDAKDSKGNVLISPTSTQRKAAMAKIAPMMTSGQTRELATSTSSMADPSMRQAATQAVAQNGAKVPFAAGNKELAAMQAGTYKEESAITDWATNRMTSESLAGMDVGAMQAVGEVAKTNNEVKKALEVRAVGIQNNAELTSKMTQPQLEFIEKYSPPKKPD